MDRLEDRPSREPRSIVVVALGAMVAVVMASGTIWNVRGMIAVEGQTVGQGAEVEFVFPVIENYGGVVALPDAPEPVLEGSKAICDLMASGKTPDQPLPGLVRLAVLLNLAGTQGLKTDSFDLVVILHGDATESALNDAAYRRAQGHDHPSGDLIDQLVAAGVKINVCGQSLLRKKLDLRDVRPGVTITASAISTILNHQSRGYPYIPSH